MYFSNSHDRRDLPMPAMPVTDTSWALPLLAGGVEQVLDEPELAVAPDERRLEALGALSAAERAGDDAQRALRVHGLRLALQLVDAGVLVGDRGLGGASGRVADEHLAGLGDRLDPRRGVDEVAGDHALAHGAEGDGGLAGQHARPGRQAVGADVGAELGDGFDQSSAARTARSASSSCGDRRAPHGHDRVADELLDGAPVPLDHRAAGVEVAGQELADLLGVAALGERS